MLVVLLLATAGTATANTDAPIAANSSSFFKIARFKIVRFTMPPSAYRIAPLIISPLYKFPRTLRYLTSNTAEFGAQDEPFLRSTTLNLHFKVRAKVPYL
jgi:hypothetical protein